MSEVLERALADLAEHPGSTVRQIAQRIGADDRDLFDVLDRAAYAGKVQRWRDGGARSAWRWEIPGTPDDKVVAVSDDELGAYWDRHLAGLVAGIPDRDAVAAMRARWIADVRANPAALREVAESREVDALVDAGDVAGAERLALQHVRERVVSLAAEAACPRCGQPPVSRSADGRVVWTTCEPPAEHGAGGGW